MSKKIAIIGTTSSLHDAPYDDPSWEIWGLNGAYTAVPRWDRWFDMHDLEILRQDHLPEYFDFLKNAGDKLMLNAKYEECPNARVFPYEKLLKKHRRYFSNTVAWLVAYAIDQNPEEIGIWGVNMASDSEYSYQRPCCEYYMGYAEGKGIKITLPDASELLKYSRIYGIEPVNPIINKLPDKEREIDAQHDDAMNGMRQFEAQLAEANGYMNGVRDSEQIISKYGNDKVKSEFAKFCDEKSERTRVTAIKSNNEIDSLLRRKVYLEGARGYHNWLKLNWS